MSFPPCLIFSLQHKLAMTFTALGRIEKLQFQDKGYHKLTVYTPCPEIKVLRFCVWNASLLQNKETGNKFEVGNKVKVVYHFKHSLFPCLDDLTPVKEGDSCPICNNTLDEIAFKEMSII